MLLFIQCFPHGLLNGFTRVERVVVELALIVVTYGFSRLEDLENDQQRTNAHDDEWNDDEENALDVGVVETKHLTVEDLLLGNVAIVEFVRVSIANIHSFVSEQNVPVGKAKNEKTEENHPFRFVRIAITFGT